MTTRELIEAVRKPKLHDCGEWNAVNVDDYYALVAACRAVLDELVAHYPHGINPDLDAAMRNARALREKLK